MTYQTKRNSIIAAIIFLVGIFLGGRIIIDKKPNILTPNIYTVISVIDGDTFKIEDNQKVRLIGIDTPEKGECYYQQAKQILEDLIKNKTVRLDKDISDKDDYGRWLRYAILVSANDDNIFINQYLVANGLARAVASPPDNRYRDLLASAQQAAYRNQLGMWNKCDYELANQDKREIDTQPVNPDCIIKGNISEKGFGKTYLVPGCDNYNSVKIDTRKGEQYFCSEQKALDAGFRKATNCP